MQTVLWGTLFKSSTYCHEGPVGETVTSSSVLFNRTNACLFLGKLCLSLADAGRTGRALIPSLSQQLSKHSHDMDPQRTTDTNKVSYEGPILAASLPFVDATQMVTQVG